MEGYTVVMDKVTEKITYKNDIGETFTLDEIQEKNRKAHLQSLIDTADREIAGWTSYKQHLIDSLEKIR
jgi:hypothetical protein